MIAEPAGRDFENWYTWILSHVGFIERAAALQLYNEAYFCDCDACKYRKEKGQIPHQAGTHCRLPVDVTQQLEAKVRQYIAR